MLEENMREWARKARREARREGRMEGRQEGEIFGMQKFLLQQMTYRFGRLPMRVRRRVEEISSSSELRKLARTVLLVSSLEDMNLG